MIQHRSERYVGTASGLIVIDQTQAFAGPYCSMMLGDMGATVIKIERPGAGDQACSWATVHWPRSSYYLAVNRNKRSMTLDITTPEGQEILRKLAAGADIFMTNLPRLATMEKYGIDYARSRVANRVLIYLAISGYGHTGPRAGQAGYDLAAEGESGTMMLTGELEGAPMRFPTPMADMTTGMFGLIGVLAALHAGTQSGEGQFIDVALLESQMTWVENYAGEYFATGANPPRPWQQPPAGCPL